MCQEDESQRVLGIVHLQSAFYLMFFGSGVALLSLLRETLLHPYKKTGESRNLFI